MTLEEINNLKAGRETDAIVGLALKLLHKYEPKAKDECAICGGIERHGNHAGYGPCFTTHMNDAMRIVENMMVWFKLEFIPSDDFGDGAFVMNHWECQMESAAYEYVEAEAKTAPLAICRAALMTTL